MEETTNATAEAPSSEELFHALQGNPLFHDVLDSLKRCETAGEASFLSECPPPASIPLNSYLMPQDSHLVPQQPSEANEFLIKYIEMQQFHSLQVEKFFELSDQFCSRYLALLKDGSQHFAEVSTTSPSPLQLAPSSVTTQKRGKKRSEGDRDAPALASPILSSSSEGTSQLPAATAELPRKKRRGNLPKRATNLLKKWLFEHLLHPYPTEEQKRVLAGQTGLSVNQISNWFINARRRILQPMLETVRQQQQLSVPDNQEEGIDESMLDGKDTIGMLA